MTYTYKATLIREAVKAKSDNWQDTADKWIVTINGQDFDYYTGIGHRQKIKTGWGDVVDKPMPPKLDDVLYSLLLDADACEMSFQEWCDNCGYDTDSRKAFDTYLACQENAGKMRKAKINIVVERERLADH